MIEKQFWIQRISRYDGVFMEKVENGDFRRLVRNIRKMEEKTLIRCYKTDCKFNNYEKSNCGYCKLSSITLTNEGCMDFQK